MIMIYWRHLDCTVLTNELSGFRNVLEGQSRLYLEGKLGLLIRPAICCTKQAHRLSQPEIQRVSLLLHSRVHSPVRFTSYHCHVSCQSKVKRFSFFLFNHIPDPFPIKDDDTKKSHFSFFALPFLRHSFHVPII
jgi:hypothetical protein